jgi:hypothetical protein
MKKHLLLFIFSLLFFVVQCFSQNNPPTAVNDSAYAFRGHAIVNLLKNDYDIDGHSIKIMTFSPPKHGIVHRLNDSIYEYNAFPSFPGGFDSVNYYLRDQVNMLWDTAVLFLRVTNPFSFDSLEINNIKAGISSGGILFNEDSLHGFRQVFEAPKGSGKNTIYFGEMWVGGLDSIDTLHFAGPSIRHEDGNYFPGPVSSIYDSAYDYKFKRLWKIRKTEIDYHLTHCWQSGYIPSQSLIDWPGNGDPTLGQAAILAPFKDWNNDGFYDPYAGDYPLIKGDEAVYFIFNDDRLPYTENKLEIEIHGMAYAFNCPDDSALWNTIFINYRIFNWSQNTYRNTFVGMFTDFDIGNATDDYIGTDVGRNSYYGYNGDNFDGTGESYEYGEYPPAQAVTILKGIQKVPDGIDNPEDCETGFGANDGTIDNECLPLCKTVAGQWEQCQVPESEWNYNYLQGLGSCGNPLHYFDTSGIACNYICPGTSDPLWCGTNGIPQTQIWTELLAGDFPYDRRELGSCGPFTFYSGEMQEMDFAFVFGRDFTDPDAYADITMMQQRIDSIRKYFVNDSTPCGLGFSSVQQIIQPKPQINIFPNPSLGEINIEISSDSTNYQYEIYDILGCNKQIGILKNNQKNIDVSGLANGLYVLRLYQGQEIFSKKFIRQ